VVTVPLSGVPRRVVYPGLLLKAPTGYGSTLINLINSPSG
jgi:hypothetical protein